VTRIKQSEKQNEGHFLGVQVRLQRTFTEGTYPFPAKGTLNLPAVTLDLKAAFGFGQVDRLASDENPLLLALGLGDNLGLPAQVSFDPVDQGSRIAAIGEKMAQAWETALLILQKQRRSTAIYQPCAVNLDGEQKPLGVNQQMPLASPDFFSPRRSHVGCLARDWS
jgi:hypothetical protein